MRILLVRPPIPRHTIGLRHLMICEPLELEYVAAGCSGHEVAILDMILESGLNQRLKEFCPDIVGTTCYINGVNEAIHVCRMAKHWNPRCLTVVGGVHASLAPEDFHDGAVDCIARGDGTSVIGSIAERWKGRCALETLPNLVVQVEHGQFIESPRADYMPDPDSLPLPRRDLLSHIANKYYYLFHQPVTLVKTTWGCWYDCNFCVTWRITGGRPYSRSPDSIADELARIDTRDVYIVDDIFLVNPSRLSEIAENLRRRAIRKNFLVYGRADFIADNESIVREWQKLGLTAVIVGLEAATDCELDAFAKRATVEQNRRAIDVLRRNRVDVYASFITGPDYLSADWERLWRFIDANGLYYVNISPWTPMPGAPVWQDAKDKLSVPRAAHGLWDLSHPVTPTRASLKEYYRELIRIYAKTVLDLRRANRLTLRTRPPVWSRAYLRLWRGALRIYWQFRHAHRHHEPDELVRAQERGPQYQRPHPDIPRTGTSDRATRESSDRSALSPFDPFDGYFRNYEPHKSHLSPVVDVPAARRWFHVVGWGMNENLYVYQQPVHGRSGARVVIRGQEFVMASSYDYLGLIGHPDIENAAIEAIRSCGTGTGGVRLTTGTNELHHALESRLAAFKRTEASVTFSSGYAANVGIMAALVGPNDRVLADECVHRSVVDGCRLAGVSLQTFRHNDPNDLECRLRNGNGMGRTLVAVEGIYSMDGDICPLPDIVDLKRRYGFLLFVDEAHSFGTLGESGRGVDEHHHVTASEVDVWMGTFSKAIPSIGGFVTGSRELIIYLQHGAAPFMFSAALPPAAVGAALSSLDVIDREPWRIARLHANSRTLRGNIRALGLDTGLSTSAIIPILLGDDESAYRMSRLLYDQGVLATAVVAPAVRHDTSRLRLCATAAMDDDCVGKIVAATKEASRQVKRSGKRVPVG